MTSVPTKSNCRQLLSASLAEAETELDQVLAYMDRIAVAALGLPEPGKMHPHEGLDDIVLQLRVQAQDNLTALVEDPVTRETVVTTLREMGYKVTAP